MSVFFVFVSFLVVFLALLVYEAVKTAVTFRSMLITFLVVDIADVVAFVAFFLGS